MDKLARPLLFLSAALLAGFVGLIAIQRKAALDKKPTAEQVIRSEDERIINCIRDYNLSSREIEAIPTYTDFTRELIRGVVPIVQARERLNTTLSTNYDFLLRYPPGGVPAGYKESYLKQNSGWRKTLLQGTNDRTRTLKAFQGEINAFFISHPKEQEALGALIDQRVSEALKSLKPGVALIREAAAARYAATVDPSVVTLRRYEQARAAFERWRERT